MGEGEIDDFPHIMRVAGNEDGEIPPEWIMQEATDEVLACDWPVIIGIHPEHGWIICEIVDIDISRQLHNKWFVKWIEEQVD